MQLTKRLHRRATADQGFTLIELVVAVATLGIIAVALTGVVIQYLKVSASTETRLRETTDIQFASTYWQRDVSSLGQREFNAALSDPVPANRSVWVDATDGGCGSSVSGGVPVVTFAWNGYTIGATNPANTWNQTTQRVAYVLVPSGSGDYALQRVWCGTGTPYTLTVARHITPSAALPKGWKVQCDGAACGSTLPNVVTLTLQVQDKSDSTSTTGTTVTLTGERRQGS